MSGPDPNTARWWHMPWRAYGYVAAVLVFTVCVVVTTWPEPPIPATGTPLTIAETAKTVSAAGFAASRSSGTGPEWTVRFGVAGGPTGSVKIFPDADAARTAATNDGRKWIAEQLCHTAPRRRSDGTPIRKWEDPECYESPAAVEMCALAGCYRPVVCNTLVSAGSRGEWLGKRAAERPGARARQQHRERLYDRLVRHVGAACAGSDLTPDAAMRLIADIDDIDDIDFAANYSFGVEPPSLTIAATSEFDTDLVYEATFTVFNTVEEAIAAQKMRGKDADPDRTAWYMTSRQLAEKRFGQRILQRACNVVVQSRPSNVKVADNWKGKGIPPSLESIHVGRLAVDRVLDARAEVEAAVSAMRERCGHV